jgi:hypothetical protein
MIQDKLEKLRGLRKYSKYIQNKSILVNHLLKINNSTDVPYFNVDYLINKILK